MLPMPNAHKSTNTKTHTFAYLDINVTHAVAEFKESVVYLRLFRINLVINARAYISLSHMPPAT